jgi:hypothetical protein
MSREAGFFTETDQPGGMMKQLSLLVTALLSFCLVSISPPAFAAQKPVLRTRDAVTPVQIRPVRPQVTTTAPGQATFPEVQSVAPAALTQGQSATLLVTGKNLHKDMRIKLGEGITTGNPTLVNDRTASVSVVVASDTAPGSRVVQVQYRDQLKHSRARISVLAAPVQSLGTAIPSAPPQTLGTATPASPPKVSAITPNSLVRGKSYSLTVTGSNLEDIRALKFGSGITAGVKDAASNKLQVDLTVAASAKPGPRQVILVDKREQSHPAAVGVTVTAAPAPSLPIVLKERDTPLQIKPMAVASSMTVQAVLPNQWAPGKSYRVAVHGSRFKDGLKADFGSGIVIEDFAVASTGKLTMTVKVSGFASPGSRSLRLRSGSSGRWTTFPAKAWVVAAPKFSRVKPTPRLVKPDLKVSVLGRIELLTPGDYLHPPPNAFTEALNEQTLFTWREQNPGLAEWYEFRLVTENGYVVDKKRIDPVKIQLYGGEVNHLPTSLRMNTAYLLDLLTKDRKTGEHAVVHGMGNQIFWWEVAGYRTYTSMETVPASGGSQSGISQTKKVLVSKNVEVEISDRWALCFPSKPTGLACSGSISGMYNQSSISVSNTDKGSRAANYPEDRWELTGHLDISHVPYASHFGVKGKGPGDVAVYMANLFLDWGDGSGAIPLEIDLSQPGGLSLLTLGMSYHHRYQRSGNYTVRIFMLPEDDIQQGPPDALASVYDAVSGSAQASAGAVVPASSDYAPYYQVLKGIQAASGPGFRFSERGRPSYQFQESPLFAQAGRAHLIYCETKTISAREDLVAHGPLHLESVAITGHNGSGSGSVSPGSSGLGAGKTKNKAGQSLQQKLTLSSPTKNSLQATKKPVVSMPTDAEISACGLLQGNADLVYYGKGRARITWSLYQGGSRMVIGSSDEPLASPQRTEGGMVLTEGTQNVPTPESFATAFLPSPVLEMSEKMVDKNYSLMVEAEVLPQTGQLDVGQVLDLLGGQQQTIPLPSGSGFAKMLSSWLVPEAHAASAGFGVHPQLAAFQQSGLKLSVLAPSKEGSSGRPVTASLNRLVMAKAYPELEVKKEKPFYVKSLPFRYRVKASDPGQPCRFVFPASTGDKFEITNLEVRNLGGKFKGGGVLDMHLYTGPGGSAARYLLPIAINNWTVASDGLTVTAGSINHSLDYDIDDAGMRIRLKKLAGQAGRTPLNLTLVAKPADTDLHLRGSSQPPEWTATAPLSENGDWYFLENSTIEVAIGNSGFYLKPQKIVLDLSAEEGMAANPGGAGKAWAGLHFGDEALLIPNLFEFQVPEANKGRISDWGIIGTHLAGKAELTAPFSTAYKEGSIGFSSISVNTGGNNLAVYRGMDVALPWPDTHLTGDAKLIYGVPGQEAYFDFSEITQNEIVKEYRGITMTVRNLLFGNFQQTGWGVRSESTAFRFEAEDVVFADNVVVPGIIYSMDGRPFLESGNSIDIPLGGKSTLGQTPVDLTAVRIGCHESGSGVFSFDFDTTFSISEVLSSVAVPVHYGLTRNGNMYQAEGPRVNPFDLEVAFPAGQPQVEAKLHIEYTGGGLSSSTADAGSSGFWWPFGVAEAHAASGAKDTFSGTLDMEMFDGPPIAAEFRLGYLDGHDYWLMRATLDLGPSGIPFVPPYLKLYKIRGGLGHNFPLDAFKSAYPLTVVEPVTDDSFLFMAGMQVGSTDGFVFTMDGDLTIKPGDGARMDFRAWLLDAQHAGDGNFQGYLQYAAGGFDGALQGHLSLLGDQIYFDIPEHACTMHFGGSQPWHIYAGRDDGPKINMHLLLSDVDGYMMLDDESLRFGGGIDYYLGCSIGHISGEIDTGLTITPEPHVSGYGKGGVQAEVCYKGYCVGTGISVRVDASALPVEASARGCVKIPIPCWNPKICRTFSL